MATLTTFLLASLGFVLGCVVIHGARRHAKAVGGVLGGIAAVLMAILIVVTGLEAGRATPEPPDFADALMGLLSAASRGNSELSR